MQVEHSTNDDQKGVILRGVHNVRAQPWLGHQLKVVNGRHEGVRSQRALKELGSSIPEIKPPFNREALRLPLSNSQRKLFVGLNKAGI